MKYELNILLNKLNYCSGQLAIVSRDHFLCGTGLHVTECSCMIADKYNEVQKEQIVIENQIEALMMSAIGIT